MFETRHSLCITYPDRKNSERYLFFRVADFDIERNTFMKAIYSSADLDIIYDPKIIGAYNREVLSNMTVIREWSVKEDDTRKSVSVAYPGTVYEIVFPKELVDVDLNDTQRIRTILCDGITIDNNAGNDLLVVIGSTQSQYIVLYCQKKDFIFTGSVYKVSFNVTDMLHSVHYFKMYYILKSDIIDTDDAGISLADWRKASTRYFYRYIKLPEEVCKYQIFDLKDYIPNYISKYLKKNKVLLQLTNNDIRKIASCIEEILIDYDLAENYFELTGYSLASLREFLPKYADDIVKSLLCDNDIDQIFFRCILQSEDAMKRCIEIVRNQWLAERTEEKDSIVAEINSLRNSLTAETEKRDKIMESAQTEEKRRQQIEDVIFQLQGNVRASEEKLSKLQVEIETELEKFSDSIVHNIALCSVVKSVGGGLGKSTSPICLYRCTPKLIQDSESVLSDKGEIEESLAENLTASGYPEIHAMEMSQLIVHCVFNQIPMIVSVNGLEIANCIAATFGRTSATVVNIPVGYTDISNIVSCIEDEDNCIFYITGVFDSFSESLFNGLSKFFGREMNQKILIISADGIDTSMLSAAIWNKSMYIDGDISLDYCGEPMLKSYTIDMKLTQSYTAEQIKGKRKLLKQFIDAGILSNIAAINYAKFMVDINSDVKSDWLLLLQLCVYAKSMHCREIITDIFESLSVDEKTKKLLSRYM